KKQGVVMTGAMILQEIENAPKQAKTKKKGPKRVALYIDGSNLFGGQYELFGPKRVVVFASLLEAVQKHYPVTMTYCYASFTPRSSKRKPHAFFSAEAVFYQHMRKTPDVLFYKGDRSPTSGKEKGVDVHLAIDMVTHAFLHRYDEMIIWTGDADFVYAVEIVRRLGIPVHAVFLPNRFSLGLAYKATDSIVFNYRHKFHKTGILAPKSMCIDAIKDPTCKQVG
ncbi:MAG: hypothetical protein ACD_48C00448G0001, partial [uncultured bacterium]